MAKPFTAYITGEQFHVSVDVHVEVTVMFLTKACGTYKARIRPLVGVKPLVNAELARSADTFLALIARIRFLLIVGPHVESKLTLLSKICRAYRARKWLDADVGGQVGCEWIFPTEFGGTVRT